MQFYFIRHAQSANNHLYATTNSTLGRSQDPELTELGARQAKLLAQFIRASDLNLTHLYTSLMIRAIETGVVVANAIGVPLVAWDDLHETGGIYLDDPATGGRIGQAGNNRAYFENRFPHLVLPATLGEAGWWHCRPFEEREWRPARAARVLAELLARHGGTEDRVAFFSHGGFFNYLLAAILKLPTLEAYWFECANTAITRIDFGERIEIAYVNRVDFLPREMIT
ncbi:MAG: histidine phosphatase family protein [Chloroflexi bacterium]|nr:histidine phosphatase family protein [Chloroflexota bacterium]